MSVVLNLVVMASCLAGAARPEPIDRPVVEGEFGAVLERQELLEAVLERNPGITAARWAWEAARERIPQARSLDDPKASYSLGPLTLAGDMPFGQQASVGQRIPFPGTLGQRSELATARTAVAARRLEELELQLATAASHLFDEYYLVWRALAVNAVHLELIEQLQSVAVRRYEAGLAPQQAPLQAEVEAAHLLHRKVVLDAQRKTLVTRLNALLHRPPRADLPPPPDELPLAELPPELEAGTSAPRSPDRPEVEAQQAEIAARRAAVELARLARYPDFEVTTSFNSMWRLPEHRWMVGVGVNVPIWRQRNRARLAEAEAHLASAESALASLEDEVRAEIEIAADELREARHVVRLYRSDVLPAARDQIAAARAGFETGAVTMLSVIDAERSLRTAELAYYEALAAASRRRAELDRALGRLPFTTVDRDPAPAVAEEAN